MDVGPPVGWPEGVTHMHRSLGVVIGTIVLSACSVAGSPSPSPIATIQSAPSSQVASASPPPATSVPTPTSGCIAEDWAPGSLDRAMALADTPISFHFQSGAPRDDSAGGWSDSVPGPAIRFDASEEHVTVEAGAGSVARLEPASTVTLIDGRLELYRLDADDRAGDDGVPDAAVDLGGDSDGLDIPLPTAAGRWLRSVYAPWQTDCAAGDGYVDLLLITG
jgi:hypothetical protein